MFIYSRLLRNRFENSLKSSFGEFVKNTPTCSGISYIMIAGFISAIITSNKQAYTHNFISIKPSKQKQMLVTAGTQTKLYMIEADNQIKDRVIETASQCELGITIFDTHTKTYTNDLDTQIQTVTSKTALQAKIDMTETVIKTNADQPKVLLDAFKKASLCEIGNQTEMASCNQCQSTEEKNKELQALLEQALIGLKQKYQAYRELEKLYQRKNGMLTTITKQYTDLKHQPRQRPRRQQAQYKATGWRQHHEFHSGGNRY